MTLNSKGKKFDLEERTLEFARDVALYCRKLPKIISNTEYSRQVIRSSGSTGANYIEANEFLSRKDFAVRIKICRKEAKESVYWLKLIVDINPDSFRQTGMSLISEGTELKKIFSSIITKL